MKLYKQLDEILKNVLGNSNTSLDTLEEKFTELEDRIIDNKQDKADGEKVWINEQNHNNQWDNIEYFMYNWATKRKKWNDG